MVRQGRPDKRKGPALRFVRFETTEPVKTPTGWRFSAIATVAWGNAPPDPSRELVFFANGEEQARIQTDELGNASAEIPADRPGSYRLWAQIVGTSILSQSRTVTIREEKKPVGRPVLVKVIPIPKPDGSFVVTCLVLAENKEPVPGAKIRAVDPNDKDGGYNLAPTNEYGETAHTVVLGRRKQLHLAYHVLGSNVSGWTRLHPNPKRS